MNVMRFTGLSGNFLVLTRTVVRRLAVAVIVASVACSSDGPSGPSAATVTVTAAADSIFLEGAGNQVSLAAVVHDGNGSVVTTDSLTWAVGGEFGIADQFVIEPTGPRTATLSYRPFWILAGVVPVTVTARHGTIQGSTVVTACPALAALVEISGTMLIGRSEPLEGRVLTARFAGSTGLLTAPLTWTSSDSAIVDLDGDSARAKAEGSAVLTAAACGVSDTVSVRVWSSGYTVTPIRPDGAQSSTGIDLSDDGAVVGTASNAGFVWRNASFTDLGDCTPRALNALGQVLCSGPGPTIWESGVATARDTLTMQGHLLNDSGWVAGTRGGTPLLWKSPSEVVTMTGTALFLRDINAAGDIAGSGLSLYGTPMLWTGGTGLQLATSGRGAHAMAVNDNGDVVGTAEVVIPAGNGAALWPSPAHPLTLLRGGGFSAYNAIARSAEDINNAGTIVGYGSRGAFVWESGRLSLLNSMVSEAGWNFDWARRVNDAGQILAQGTNTVTGYSGAVLLSPP